MLENMDKVFFTPGDEVVIKHNLPTKPIMLVKGKETKVIHKGDFDSESKGTHFKGIRCFWFTNDGFYQEETFSTKDLIHVKDATNLGQWAKK